MVEEYENHTQHGNGQDRMSGLRLHEKNSEAPTKQHEGYNTDKSIHTRGITSLL